MSDNSEDTRRQLSRPLVRPSMEKEGGSLSGTDRASQTKPDKGESRLPSSRSLSLSRINTRDGRLNLPAVRDSAAVVTASPASTGMLSRVLVVISDFLKSMDQPAPTRKLEVNPMTSALSEPPVFTILVASICGDAIDGAASFALFKLLESRSCLKVRQYATPFVLNNSDDEEEVTVLGAMLAHTLSEEEADLLIWGEVNPTEGYRLHMAVRTPPHADNTSPFTLSTQIFLPKKLGEIQSDMLYGAVLTAMAPANPIQRGTLRRLLPSIAAIMEEHCLRIPATLIPPEQRSLLVVYGHVASLNASMGPKGRAGEWYIKGIEAYQSAENRLGVNDPEWETGLLARHLALSYSQWAEKSQDTSGDFLEQSVIQWRRAVAMLSQKLMPNEWAQSKIKLGQSLYRLDMKIGDINLLRESVQVLQSVLQVHTRLKSPHRWTEIIHSLSLVLQIYGDQLKSEEVLKRAVDSARLVLEMRSYEHSIMAWAAAKNTLGSSLFMLGKHTKNMDVLGESMSAFQEALSVFRSRHNSTLMQVTSRNIAHVEQMIAGVKSHPAISDPLWVR